MFPLHERTRHFLCRSGFLLLCVVPTATVLTLVRHYRSPAYLEARREEWCAVLGDRLGVRFECERLSFPAWNVALLENVSLMNSESGAMLGSARSVEVVREEGRWSIAAEAPEIRAERLEDWSHLVRERLLRGRAPDAAPIRFEARSLTFHGETNSQTFENVEAEIASQPHGVAARAEASIAGDPSARRFKLGAERVRGEASAETHIGIECEGASFPCYSFRPLFPWLADFGENARFTGTIHLAAGERDSHAEITGTFTNVELHDLLVRRFPHHEIGGLANISLTRFVARNGAISEAKGSVTDASGGGYVSRSLVESLGNALDLAPEHPTAWENHSRAVYRRLAFSFQLDAAGLTLEGSADPERRGVIMTASHAGALLEETTPAVIPAVALVRALSPQSESLVPATHETKPLLDLLPIPSRSAEFQARAARVRLQK